METVYTNSALIVGDSITDDVSVHAGRQGNWPYHLASWPDFQFQNLGTASDKLIVDIEPTFATDVGNRESNADIAIIQGGVNDVQASATAANMWAATSSMITTAKAAGMSVIVINVMPWKNAVTWSAGEQTVTDDYNALLAANEASSGFTLVDAYSALEDPANADEMLPAYDSGDGLHPNSDGGAAIAALVDTALASLYTTRAAKLNPLKLWRGAVEPAETGASGNEFQSWRGAVEPVGATVDPSGYYGAVMQLTRGLTEPLVRNVST